MRIASYGDAAGRVVWTARGGGVAGDGAGAWERASGRARRHAGVFLLRALVSPPWGRGPNALNIRVEGL